MADRWGRRYGQPPHRLFELDPLQVAIDTLVMKAAEPGDHKIIREAAR